MAALLGPAGRGHAGSGGMSEQTRRYREGPGYDHPWFDWPPPEAPPAWPGGVRLAVMPLIHVEHFELDPDPDAFADPRFAGALGSYRPDYNNFTRRLYGLRVGVWRIFDILKAHGLRATVALGRRRRRAMPADRRARARRRPRHRRAWHGRQPDDLRAHERGRGARLHRRVGRGGSKPVSGAARAAGSGRTTAKARARRACWRKRASTMSSTGRTTNVRCRC